MLYGEVMQTPNPHTTPNEHDVPVFQPGQPTPDDPRKDSPVKDPPVNPDHDIDEPEPVRQAVVYDESRAVG
jgi:hypothetical protein